MPSDPLVPIHMSINIDNRITLPKHFSDRLTWITGKEVKAWLFLTEPGRHRLLSDEEVRNDPQLEPVCLLILQEKSAIATEPSHAERFTHSAIVARLIPITISAHQGSWRIPFPKEFKTLAPIDSNPNALSILFSPEGYVEIWHTDVLRKAAYSPLG